MDWIQTFNIVDMVLVAILLLSLISGMYKGFLSSGLTTVGFGAAFFGAKALYPQLAHAVLNNTNLMEVLTYYLDPSSMFKTVGLAEKAVSGATQNGLLMQALADLKAGNLPEAIVSAFRDNVDKLIFSGKQMDTFADYLNLTIWNAAINVVSFLVLFMVTYLLVMLVVNLLNNVFHFPLLRHFDWLLGGAFGLVRGVIIVSLVLAIVPLAMSVINIDIINKMIESSQLASMFQSEFIIRDIIVTVFQ